MNASKSSSTSCRLEAAAVRVWRTRCVMIGLTRRVVIGVGIAATLGVGALVACAVAQTNSSNGFSPYEVRGGAMIFETYDTLASPADSVAAASTAAGTAAAPVSALMLAARELRFVAAASLPPGATHAMIRTDPETGGIERFIRFPAGLEIAEHWHSASETVLLLEGDLTFAMSGEKKILGAGSYCFIPARTVHAAWIGDAGAVIYQRTGGPPDRHLVSDEGSPK